MAVSKYNKKNSYGLSRFIPEDIQRTVRQQCGFGCVICGNGIYEYEHHTPPFKRAKEHKAEGITLLCMQCHGKKTRGYLTEETVKKAILNPKCLTTGFSKEMFDIAGSAPSILFAGSIIERCPIPVQILNQPLMVIEPADILGAPFLISAKFQDSKGNATLEIIKNEWRAMNNNWDVEASGGKIRISEAKRKTVLTISAKNANQIIIERINCTIGGYNIMGNEKEMVITDLKKCRKTVYRDCCASDCQVGFSFQ